MTDKGSDSVGLIGPVDETSVPEDGATRQQTPSTEDSETTPALQTGLECDTDGAARPLPSLDSRAEIGRGEPAPAIADRLLVEGTVNASPDGPMVEPVGEISRKIPDVRPPVRDEIPGQPGRRSGRHSLMAAGFVMVTLVAVAGWRLTDGSGVCYPSGPGHDGSVASLAADTVANRIVLAESGGNATARNKRSSATGAGQFLDGTWLDMIRAYRPDLGQRSEAEILDLRQDPDLSREMVSRFAEGNAKMLQRRCLPVTAGTLYLSHFAGGAGAVAVLSAPRHADAASTMASADSRGRITRKMIVTANPFLRDFTVTDLQKWAERKMLGPGAI